MPCGVHVTSWSVCAFGLWWRHIPNERAGGIHRFQSRGRRDRYGGMLGSWRLLVNRSGRSGGRRVVDLKRLEASLPDDV